MIRDRLPAIPPGGKVHWDHRPDRVAGRSKTSTSGARPGGREWQRRRQPECEVEVDREVRSDRTWLLEGELGIGSKTSKKSGAGRRRQHRPAIRIELWRMLALVALAGLLFAAIR